LVIAECPADFNFWGFIESILKFFRHAFAFFGREFRTLPWLSALARLPGLRVLLTLSWLSVLSWLPGALSALTSARAARPATATSSSTHLFYFVAEADQLMRFLIEEKTDVETIGALAVDRIEFAAFGARRLAGVSEFNLSRCRSGQQPAEHDLVKLA